MTFLVNILRLEIMGGKDKTKATLEQVQQQLLSTLYLNAIKLLPKAIHYTCFFAIIYTTWFHVERGGTESVADGHLPDYGC